MGVIAAPFLLLLFVEEAVLERLVRGTLVGRRAGGTRPRCSGLPSGKHHDGPIAVDDDDPRVVDPRGTPQNDEL
jgi:hypothetical protein